MNNNVKSASLIVLLVMVLGTGALFINESNAQGKIYKIGDKGPAGGWVFYDKGDSSGGWRYLEAAPKDQGIVQWGCEGKSINGAQSSSIGTGKKNTQAIVKSCGQANIAAKVCTAYRGGEKSDWFLPSKDELNLMYENLHKAGIGSFGVGGFPGYYYWSSSEEVLIGYSSINACSQDFTNFSHSFPTSGYQCVTNKHLDGRVRAVRAF